MYKLLRQRKDGTLGPLFINRRQRIPLHAWIPAEAHRTKGYAFRPGWHAVVVAPYAPHLSSRDRVWARVSLDDCTLFERPPSQGGTWALGQRMRVEEIMSPEAVEAACRSAGFDVP